MPEPLKKHSQIENFGDKVNTNGFTSDKQPDPDALRLGWAKKKTGVELAKLILELPFKGKIDDELRKAVAAYFDVPEDTITVEQMMKFRQIEKAIQESDTQAFKAVMERAHGAPKQEIEQTTKKKYIVTIKP